MAIVFELTAVPLISDTQIAMLFVPIAAGFQGVEKERDRESNRFRLNPAIGSVITGSLSIW